MDIAFVGLGQMGRPMAINMLKSGARVTVTSASGKRHPGLEARGAMIKVYEKLLGVAFRAR